MSNETVVRLTGDASGYVSELDRARKSAADFVTSQDTLRQRLTNSASAIEASRKALQDQGQAAVDAFNKSARSAETWLTSLQKQADQAGKSRAQLMELRAAELGVSDAAQPYIDKIKAAEAALNSGGHAAHGFNLETAAARRELLVLAHEAAQGSWKNFGGSLLVLGERTDMLSAALSATGLSVGLVLAGFAALGYAAVKGAEDVKRFNAALVLTSNYAGLTRDALDEMAARVSDSSGASLGKSTDVLMGLAESGKYTSQEMASLADVIVRTSMISGQSLEDVSKEYAKLADDPAKWAAEHNASMHFMDVATYEHIRALQEAGDKHQAIQAVIEATAAQVEQSSQTHLSAAAQAWRSLSQEIDTFWAKLKQGASSGPSLQDQIDTLSREREEISSSPMLPLGTSREDVAARIAEINRQIEALGAKQKAENDAADAAGKAAQQQQAAIDAETRIDKMRDQIMSNAQKRQKELKQLAADRASIVGAGGKFSDADYASMVAGINDKYKDPKEVKPKAYADDAATKFLQQLRDQAAELQSQLSTTGKLTNSQKELAKFNQQISDWQGKTLTADQKSLLAHQDQIRAQLQVNIGKEEELQKQEAINKLKERSAQIDASILSYQQGQRDQYSRQLDAFGMGSDAVKNAQAVKSIYAEYQHLKEQLDKSTDPKLIGGKDYNDEAAKIKAGLEQSLQDYDAYYAALKAKQGDWVNGFTAGVANYLDSAHNMAAQTESAFTNVMKGMEDSLTSFVTTGKFNFSSFAMSVIADIARIQARAAISGLLGSAISTLGSMFGNTGATISANSQGTGLDGLINATGGWGTVPARATGGPVDGGSAYLIGEKGPELFVPGASGAVVPNHALSSIAGSGGGSSSVSVSVPVTVQGNESQSDQQNAADLSMKIKQAVQAVLQNERKQGGVLWKIQNQRA